MVTVGYSRLQHGTAGNRVVAVCYSTVTEGYRMVTVGYSRLPSGYSGL